MKTKYLVLIALVLSLAFNGCVKDEIFQGPPIISDMVLNPQVPSENQAVTVTVKVTDMNELKTVTLHYTPGSGARVSIPMTSTVNNLFTAQIPGQAADVTVNFYIEAENNSGKISYHPSGAPATTAAYTVGAPLIVMNEIYSRGLPEDPDWIEIYNGSDVPVDISGYTVYDNGGQSGAKPKLPVPDGTIIPAKGFYVVVTDIGGENGFGISSGGEELWLENDKGNVIDNVNCLAMDITQSYGRNPDGVGSWELLNTITRGGANSTSAPAPLVKMNEIFSQGAVDNPDWIELHNGSNFTAEIGGYKIYDSGGQSGSKPKFEIPAGTTIPAFGFVVIVVDDGTASGFGLSSGGEEVWLENAAGTILDNATFPALEATQSYGRYPDGTENWQVLFVVTRGLANDNSTPPPPAPVLMNEIYSRGTTDDPDWIEIYNPTNNPVDISGYKIYDSGGNAGTKPKKEFPAGTSIPAGGFVVIATEGTGDASDFGLSSGGETVWLENIEGSAIDSIAFPAMDVTQSFGRMPDGTENWQLLNTITRGAPNSNATPIVVLLNELYSRGTTEDPDWIEIFNASTTDADISGFKIYDSGGNAGTKPKKEIPAGTIIPAGGFFAIATEGTGDVSDFGLSSGGEKVWLENVANTVIDSVEFIAMEATQSYGRFPDGSENWQILNTITRGSANSNAMPNPIFMNEIFSRGTTEDPDWIEVYNTSTTDFDISGYKIYDSGGQAGTKPKKEFPAGSVIPASGFLVIVVDDADASGFGLSSGGEEVWLENANGELIDDIVFPAMTEVTYSYGRKPDGSANFFIFTEITRGASNNNAATLGK
ncbi:MAG: lamin tail domain-containing protein [Bacteroidales bacterium]|nr:lamin tail domain-containing protein [Bacteroidales bacterium]